MQIIKLKAIRRKLQDGDGMEGAEKNNSPNMMSGPIDENRSRIPMTFATQNTGGNAVLFSIDTSLLSH